MRYIYAGFFAACVGALVGDVTSYIICLITFGFTFVVYEIGFINGKAQVDVRTRVSHEGPTGAVHQG